MLICLLFVCVYVCACMCVTCALLNNVCVCERVCFLYTCTYERNVCLSTHHTVTEHSTFLASVYSCSSPALLLFATRTQKHQKVRKKTSDIPTSVVLLVDVWRLDVRCLSGTKSKKFLSGYCLNSLVRHICTWETPADFYRSLRKQGSVWTYLWQQNATKSPRKPDSPMSRALFGFTHKANTQRRKRKQVIGSWLHPPETNKIKNAVVTRAACTGATHKSCSYRVHPHEACVSQGTDLTPLKTADRQSREAVWLWGFCRKKLRISSIFCLPVCVFAALCLKTVGEVKAGC